LDDELAFGAIKEERGVAVVQTNAPVQLLNKYGMKFSTDEAKII
jgi:hypothetical protein